MSAAVGLKPLYQGSIVIAGQNPKRFGNNQADYLEMANATICKSIKEIKDSLATKDVDVKKIFFACFENFCTARAQIAKKHKTANYQEFGQKRTICATTATTPLFGEYEKCGTQIKQSILSKILLKQEYSPQVQGRLFDIPKDEVGTLIPHPKSSNVSKEQQEKEIHQQVWQMKTSQPALFRQIEDYTNVAKYQMDLWLKGCMINLLNPPPQFKVGMVSATVNMQVDKVLIPAAEYITLYCTPKLPTNQEEAARALEAHVQITHMEPEYIDSCMQEIAKIFARVVTTKYGDETSLKRDLAEFRHRFAFCMPCLNGSAAISEWFEVTLAALHKFRVVNANDILIDLEAFANPDLAIFIQNYAKIIQLEPLDENY